MANNIAYTKLLSSPEWKARRLQIIERDGCKCTSCGSESDQGFET